MDEKLLNDIAALEACSLTPEEEKKLRALLAEDSTATLLLHSGLEGDEPEAIPGVGLPFPVNQKARVGVCEGYLRLFDQSGLILPPSLDHGISLLRSVAGDWAPLCVRGSLTLEFGLARARGSLNLLVRGSSDHLDLVVQVVGPTRHRDYIEIWENGVPLVVNRAERRVVEVPVVGSATLAIRHTASPFGIGLRVAPILFEPSDWLSACVFAALEGSFAHAASLLPRVTPHRARVPSCLHRLQSFLEMLRGLTKVEGFDLIPVPMIRGPVTLESAALLYGVVWKGVIASWPECKDMEDSGTSGFRSNDPDRLSPAVLQLMEAVRGAIAGEPPQFPSRMDHQDPRVLQGWAALESYHHLLLGEPDRALATLDNLVPPPEDPFGLSEARVMANHLSVSARTPGDKAEMSRSTLNVWRQVFAPVVESQVIEDS